MISLSGTLEGFGPNKSGLTDAPASSLGYTSIGNNASTSPPTQELGRGGPNTLNDTSSPLVNMVNQSADTTTMPVPAGGTIESGGING